MEIGTTTTVLGWVVIVGVGGVLYLYNQQQNAQRRTIRARNHRSSIPAATIEPIESRPAGRARRREETTAKVRRSQIEKDGLSATTTQLNVAADEEEKEDNSWVQELAARKAGTKLSAPKSVSKLHKTVKQGRANKVAEQSATSSNMGDEDTPPAQSPALSVEESNGMPNGKDVSDMLEASAPGPAILRLTEPLSTHNAKPKMQAKPAVTAEESKKQRQNRQKVEEKKLQRAAEEKERRALEEKQRRTAREARGEPARNGVTNITPPLSNAWKSAGSVNNDNVANGAASDSAPYSTAADLLDTFVPSTNSKTIGSAVAASKSANGGKYEVSKKFNASQNRANGGQWWSDLPSEEEQERLIREQDEGSWNTVVTKKGKKKVKSIEGVIEDDRSSEHSSSAHSVQAPGFGKKAPELLYDVNGTYVGSEPFNEADWEVR